jgi:hypothetical protein
MARASGSVVFLAALATAGCSLTEQTGGPSACTIALSGGVTKTLTCTAAAAYSVRDGHSTLAIQSTALGRGGLPEAQLSVTLPGEIATRAYDRDSTESERGSVDDADGAGDSYECDDGDDAPGSSGTSVQVTAVEPYDSTADGTVFHVHGTAAATLTQAGAAPVAMRITF